MFDESARDSLITTHDATLAKLYDQSGHGFDAIQDVASQQPYIKYNGTVQGLNGNQGALFIKSNANRLFTASVNHGIGTNDFCLSLIVQTDSSFGAWEGAFGISTYAPGFYFNRASGPAAGFFWGADYLFSALSTSTTYVLTYIKQAGEYKMYVNGVLEPNHPSIVFSDVGSTTVLNIMSDSLDTDYGGGTVLEYILWKGIPTNLAAIISGQKTHAGI